MIERTRHEDIHELRLARPPVNALNPELCARLVETLAGAVADGARGIVLCGGPGAFSAGLDVPHLLTLDARGVRAAWQGFIDAARALAQSPVPVVAALNGHAPAGGCVLALCCDWRVMAEGPFTIGLNETQVGIAIPPGIMQLLQRTVGPRRAEAVLVPGQMVESEQALQIGLVDELAGIDHVVTRAMARLDLLLDLPRGPMLETRRVLRKDLQDALSPENMQLEQCLESWHSEDTQQALRAMVARLGKG